MLGFELLSLIRIRFWLLLRQKLGWISLVVGGGLVFLSLITAQVSFVSPAKIFWDFSLGVIFVLEISLAVFLGTQLYSDEKYRRTLHLILSAGVSRFHWIVGNILGLWLALLTMLSFWYVLTLITSFLVYGTVPFLISFQAMFLLAIEILIVLILGFFTSLYVRPILSLAGTAALVIFLHSLTSLQRIFTDPQVGRFVDDKGVSILLWLARLFPPLEWFDLKLLVGYEASVSWGMLASMTFLGIIWATIIAVASWLRFEKMDL